MADTDQAGIKEIMASAMQLYTKWSTQQITEVKKVTEALVQADSKAAVAIAVKDAEHEEVRVNATGEGTWKGYIIASQGRPAFLDGMC